MTSISSLFAEAQLAEASYADLSGPQAGSTITDPQQVRARLVAEDFSDAQAAAFVEEWRVIHQYTASGGLLGDGSGFSGTLFQNIATGAYSFSLRGTAGATDLSADIGDIVADGIVLDQIVDMYNYWKNLTQAGAYQAKQLVTMTTETADLNAAYAVSPLAGLAYESILRARTDIVIDRKWGQTP